ncbi:MAG: sugar kinase [Firmicutes bacterium HGW-Firmicutes-16]|nr:MAG: sugar kinase [Firmicutes bacterium HGW-Firmicutes-16]
MTIREIAEMANVSVSTVSKVINKKDDSISAETRERILGIVKMYHYSPYMDRQTDELRPSLIIGVLIGESADYGLLTGIVKRARVRGYSTIVCTFSSGDEETQNFQILAAHHVDGIIWNKELFSGKAVPKDILQSQIKLCTLNREEKVSATNTNFSYFDLGYAAAGSLINQGHKNIGCLYSKNGITESDFADGIGRCLYDHKLFSDDGSIRCMVSDCDSLWLQAHTGIVCFDTPSLNRFAAMAEKFNIRVPEDISVLGIDSDGIKVMGVQVSSITKPFEEIGEFTADNLINAIEACNTQYTEFHKEYKVSRMDSIVPPKKREYGHFVVVGSTNIDTLLSVDKQPEPGETITIRHRVDMPGGKGLNQAVGIAKLGASAALISSIGNDYDGRQIFECLKSNSVCADGVTARNDIPTGHAYIYIQKNAESNISILDGANAALTTEDIDKCEYLFENADYCLLQTELKQSVVLHAAKMAHKHKVKVILKPCAVSSLIPELLQNTDVLVPNIKEAEALLPQFPSVEDKAKYFKRHGAKTVIITMGDKGCFLLDAERKRYFPAIGITPVDTTGAADAFVAALAFYLFLGKSVEEAIKYATCAGGLSTTRHGVPGSLVDRETLELYYFEHKDDFGSDNE